MDNKSLSHTKWKCQYRIVLFLNTGKGIIWAIKKRCQRNTIYTL